MKRCRSVLTHGVDMAGIVIRPNYKMWCEPLQIAMTSILLFIVGYYVVLSLCSFVAYGYDKRQSRRNRWRVRESTLHKIDWLGGWPGGWLARRYLRHKSIKPTFRRVFFWTVLSHSLLWIGVAVLWWQHSK